MTLFEDIIVSILYFIVSILNPVFDLFFYWSPARLIQKLLFGNSTKEYGFFHKALLYTFDALSWVFVLVLVLIMAGTVQTWLAAS